MGFRELLKEKEFIILDGAMGTMLQAKGLKMGETPEAMNIEKPEWLLDIHRRYVEAGSDVIYANTFGANRHKLAKCGYSVDKIIGEGIKLARQATEGTDTLVALDIGSIGQMLEPTGTLAFEEAYDIFKEMVIAGKEADVVVFETMTDLYELKAAILAAKENSDLPIMCTMTFEQNMRTFTGVDISAMCLTAEGLGVDAVGVNCSLGPKELYPVVEKICQWTNLPVVVKPNAGLPDPVTNEYNCSAEEFAELAKDLIPLGIKIIGGCCGTDPKYIACLKEMLADKKAVQRNVHIPAVCCSATDVVVIDQPRIIGERINPTGKKRFKQALLDGDIDYILGQAIEQINAGADILDVNVGLPAIDEKAMMVRAVKALQGVVDVPLQLDSTIPEVMETALRVYNGKPIVNSVNAEEKSLNTVLPLVKKYGAAVVGLTLDENGIPKTADERFKLAKKILDRAMAIGIRREDVYIDCLTLTASAEQENVMQTVNAVRRVKEELGLRTVLGVSNISFGLPSREIVNHNFLMMCLTSGLDLPIMNPNIDSMTATVRAYKLLTNIDKNSVDFIAHYGADTSSPTPKAEKKSEMDLPYAIENGLKGEGAEITAKLLETTDAMVIINEMLVPALDKAGEQFEKGKIFLPQLIQTAGVAQACFEVIKQKMLAEGGNSVSKGKIILATVKGDIHDIGKNIVKVLLENYGYDVIDLGKDVDYQTVVDAAIENDVHLVGLSALMTTTLVSMEETIKLLRANNVDCKIMVGGAVVTPDYAEQIGADFYSKDAKQSVDIARQVFGN
ncbi:homocysteine S-methyltransferase family protein [Ruminococcus sp.]|uniref:homocysteine S-methyltransferase family protein n=1 Tax=Ruminococcus sp. TaxID=41978 RepID=UPI0025FD2E89|nr:homocysteine S-methyltransferase family protein [Ruminococcus sp.]MBQ8967638.1 homocysteine S-methyltransferase family protein [Ruminococcus sp.]